TAPPAACEGASPATPGSPASTASTRSPTPRRAAATSSPPRSTERRLRPCDISPMVAGPSLARPLGAFFMQDHHPGAPPMSIFSGLPAVVAARAAAGVAVATVATGGIAAAAVATTHPSAPAEQLV